jgi:hypothetical protein
MLQLYEPILADDPEAVLQYERGTFELTSPSGKRLRVVCPQNRPLELSGAAKEDLTQRQGWWRIEKIAET